MRRDDLISLAGDMWNQLENLRSLWEGTAYASATQELIDEYERLTDLAPVLGED